MSDKSFQLKLVLSAIAGFLIAATLVFIPGTLFMRPSRREGAPREILGIYHHDLVDGIYLKPEERQQLEDLINRAGWLCIAQNELDCFPFSLLVSSIGPAALIIRRRRNKT